jgi:hypothetical protein
MGTRSRIAVMHGDKCKSVYCHWDGYLEHNGLILQEHYDSAKANHLVALGDLSSLRQNIGEKHAFSHFDLTPAEREQYKLDHGDSCTFYGRDRGEEGFDFAVDLTFAKFFERADGCCAEWYYIMQDGVWYVGNTYESDTKFYKKLVLLSEALETVKETA